MALLLREREAAPASTGGDPGDAESIVVPDYACAACGAGMEGGQDWCLECGTAAPGRLGGRPGWRAALTVVSLTLLLVGGAVIASYAAISGDATRSVAGPAGASGAPIVAQAPAPGATTPAVPAPPATGATPLVPAPKPKPAAPAKAAPATPAAPGPEASSPAPSGDAGAGANQGPSFGQIDLSAGALASYDPYDRPGAELGPPGNAADGLKDTVWDVSVPADGETVRVGLLVDLGRKRALDSLTVTSPTPGYTVEVYATTGDRVPADILDTRWTHLTDVRSGDRSQRIGLRGKSDASFRRVVLWFTRAAEADDPRIAVGEVAIRASK